MKFTACPGIGGNKMNQLEVMELAKKYGIDAIEFYSWWNADIPAIMDKKAELDIAVRGICTSYFNLVDITKQAAYLKGIEESIPMGQKLGCYMLISQVGNDIGIERRLQRKAMIQTLRKAAPMMEEAGLMLAIEPLNMRVNHMGYFLASSDEAFDIVDEVGSPAVKILFDIYHQQITEGDVLRHIRPNMDKICHFHCAGSDGRNELYLGELNYPYIFKEIDKLGYEGYCGLEYTAVEDPDKGLRYVMDYAK